MNNKLFSFFLALFGLAFMAGCGGGGGSTPGATKNAQHESLACIGCHEGSNWKTPGTGKPIVYEYYSSTHYKNNRASCQDCHTSGYMHPASCARCHTIGGQAVNPLLNPDTSGRCANCHAKVNPRPGLFDGFNTFSYEDPNIPALPAGSTTRFIHFSTGKRANFVSTNYINNCRKCHNPHDTSSGRQQRRDWAQSGHGATNTNPRTNSDFKFSGSLSSNSVNYGNTCVRCHTSTGPIKFITSGFSDVKALDLPATDKSREVTACDVCHDDGLGYAYGYKVRAVPQLTNFYNYSAGIAATALPGAQSHISISNTFPDIKASNVCLVCHVGREIGAIITKANLQNVDFKKVAFMSSHFLTAGASLFQISGYEFAGRDYTSQGAYPYLHNQIGRTNSDTSGPCVTCHMKPGRHTFLPVTLGNNAVLWQRPVTTITSPECNGNCHGRPTPVPGLPALVITTTAGSTNLNTVKSGFFATLEALKVLLQTNGMFYGRGGIKTTGAFTTNVTNWEKLGANSGPDTMGVAFNYVLLNFDYGAYVHNSTYAKRLLYDSIDRIDDVGGLNYSTCTTISGNAAAYQYLCNSTSSNTAAERP